MPRLSTLPPAASPPTSAQRYTLLPNPDYADKWYLRDTKTGRNLCYGSRKLCRAMQEHLNWTESVLRRQGIAPD